MNTQNKVEILSVLTTRDSAGRHFTEKFSRDDLNSLEAEGLITIKRPTHDSGIPYDQSYWSVSVTDEGVSLVEGNPESCAVAE